MRFFNIFALALATFFCVSLGAQATQDGSFYGEAFEVLPKVDPDVAKGALSEVGILQTQLTGKINGVCQVKGCWMKVTLENKQEVFVKFKDYGFFVPTDSSDKNVVVNGILFQDEISVEDQKHYAKDRGDSPEEIAKITAPLQQLRFEADGVLITD
ncbi:MAG: DUF4920 domain-containing protein [Bacteroidota bacterium]